MKITIEFEEEYAPDVGAMLVKHKDIPMSLEIQGNTDEVFDLADFLESHDIYPEVLQENFELDQLPF